MENDDVMTYDSFDESLDNLPAFNNKVSFMSIRGGNIH